MLALALSLAGLSVSPKAVSAQLFDRLTNPKITVTLKHPPGLGLQVNRIAFGPARGPKADEIVDAISGALVGGGMQVLDRQHLAATLAEHQLNLSGYVDRQSAVAMGKFLGSTALLLVNVARAVTQQDTTYSVSEDSRHNRRVVYNSRTQAFLKVSVQTVDLTTGVIFQARVFEANPQVVNTADDRCCAVFPSEYDVFDAGVRQIVGQVYRLFMPWNEPAQLYFFSDKDCEMRAAFTLLQEGDVAGADKKSRDNVEVCKATSGIKDKQLAHSYYNAGMTAFLLGNYDRASELFAQAQKIKEIGITTDAITDLNRAKALAAQTRLVEERAAVAAQLAPAAAASAPRSAAEPVSGRVVGSANAGGRAAAAARKSALTPGGVGLAGVGAKSGETVAVRLRQLNDLLSQGLITKEEFTQKKTEILKSM